MKGLIFYCCFFAVASIFAQKHLTVDEVIEEWHQAAAEANFEKYTSLMTQDCVFIGTDASENWKGEKFLSFAKPYFDNGKAWTFYKLERHIFNESSMNYAWFDELLDTEMGICRGSGILEFTENRWKMKHYVLSLAIPNDNIPEIKTLNQAYNKSFIESLKN